MRCLSDFKTALTKVYYFTVGHEASLAGLLFIFWVKGVYLPIVDLLGPVFQVDEGVPCFHFPCLRISALCDRGRGTQICSWFDSRLKNHFFFGFVHLKFSTFYLILSLMRCLGDFKTALTKVWYFTVGREASFAGQLFIFWLQGVYLPIVCLLGPCIPGGPGVPCLHFPCLGISALCDCD